MTKQMPVLFIGHGSPTNALEKNSFAESLTNLRQQIPEPENILIISAHWQTQGTKVLSTTNLQTLHDFSGFPRALSEYQYPGVCANNLASILHKKIPEISRTSSWGLDHGAWTILHHLYPAGDIPVTQLSLDINKSLEEHFELGQRLAFLRSKKCLIIGSGNIVHNLALLSWKNSHQGTAWAIEFDELIKIALENRNTNFLVTVQKLEEISRYSIPTEEHYIPLLYTYGATQNHEQLSFPYVGFENGSISMRSVMWS